MIKNELVKFFTPFKVCLYGGIIFIFILLDDVIFQDSTVRKLAYYDFLKSNMETLVFVLPIILAPIVSEIFTHDYESGCMKFFVIYRRREEVLFSKIIALLFITTVIIIIAFVILSLIYIGESGGQIHINVLQPLRMIVLFLFALMPILLIYVLISVLCKNSTIVSLLVFLLVIMSDFIPKVIGDITPRIFLWNWLIKGQIDELSITLFLVYMIVFIVLDVEIFNRKEIIH